MHSPTPPPVRPAAGLAELDRLWAAARPRLLAALDRRITPRLGPRTDPDEMLARTYVRAVRRWERVRARGREPGYSWLRRLALDEVIEAWRRETRGRRDCRRDTALPDRSSALLGLGLVATGTTPSQAAVRAELQSRVRRVLGRLRPADRGVLLMRFEERMAFQEIAALIGTTESAATVRCNRALTRLRDQWVTLFGEGGGA